MPGDSLPLEVLLTRAGAAVVRHRRWLAAQHGLTPTAIAVLTALDDDAAGATAVDNVREGGSGAAPSHRELAGRVGLSPATLTPVLDVLETAGEVRRERDRVDRRVVRVHRTSAGRSHLAAARSPALLPQPAPEVEPALRAYLLAVLAAVEAQE